MMSESLSLLVDLQQCIDSDSVPAQKELELWIKTSLIISAESRQEKLKNEYELTIRIVDKKEIQNLNNNYRHKNQATNVLSFPYEGFDFDVPEELQLPLLGDLVICHEVVLEEAQQQGKTIDEHWAHMVVHGILHLQGYDHINDHEAEQMEALEVNILKQLNFPNPYW